MQIELHGLPCTCIFGMDAHRVFGVLNNFGQLYQPARFFVLYSLSKSYRRALS